MCNNSQFSYICVALCTNLVTEQCICSGWFGKLFHFIYMTVVVSGKSISLVSVATKMKLVEETDVIKLR